MDAGVAGWKTMNEWEWDEQDNGEGWHICNLQHLRAEAESWKVQTAAAI